MLPILEDLDLVLRAVQANLSDKFFEVVLKAPRIFLYGLGRSGLIARSFGMRLVHLGREATIVGDTTTPAIRSGDVLIVCSCTGKSPILRHAVRLAHQEQATAIAIVGQRRTALAKEADCVVRLPIEAARNEAAQPMGSLFEQALLLYLDSMVIRLMERLSITAEDMERVHSNLP